MARTRLVFGLIGVPALVLLSACGGNGGEEGTAPETPTAISTQQSTAIANQIVSAVLRAFTSIPGANGQPAAQQTVTVGGTIQFDATPGGSGSCQIQLTMTVNISTRTGTATGTVCGNPVTASGSA